MRSAALAPVALAAAATSRPAPPDAWVQWTDGAARYSAAGVTVRIEPRPLPRVFPDLRIVTPHLTVTRRGVRPFHHQAENVFSPNRPLRLAIRRINRGERAAVLLDQDTGGAHCCRRLVAITPARAGWKIVGLGSFDGVFPGLVGDLSGDGRGDLVVEDDRFKYAFASYADGWGPPRVFNVVGGRRIDVSRHPGFAPLFRRRMAKARRACERPKRGYSPNGACAAYAADAARLGRFAEAWPVVLRSWRLTRWRSPEGCRTSRDGVGRCPAKARIAYRDYPAALRGFLMEKDYLPKR